MIKRNPDSLKLLVEQLEGHIAHKDLRKDVISTSDVAWQIDHSLKVINLVSESLVDSDPKSYVSKFNKWRFLLFNLNYIPRGKARAPKIVKPPEIISDESILIQLQLAHQNIEKIRLANKKSHFKHFVFGVLNKERTIQFLHLHTNHHLKIIRDIVN